jgi:1-acyl-sn-glycerol-3-phosphate acyltransferase
MAKMQMIAIDRKSGRRALEKMEDKAKRAQRQNRVIIIFPEGTRTLPGEKNKYKSGFYTIYKNLNLEILPIALNTGCCWSKKSFIRKPAKVTIQILPSIKTGKDKVEVLQLIEDKIEQTTSKLCKEGLNNV